MGRRSAYGKVPRARRRKESFLMRIDAIQIGETPPDDINVIIEVPIGGETIKYEMDKDAGAMYVDRFVYTAMRYPGNYGFVPHTMSDDGDHNDVMVVNTSAIVDRKMQRMNSHH